MSDIATDIVFKNSENGQMPTPNKLNLAFQHALIQPSFFSSKPSVTSPGSGDQVLLLRSDNTYAQVPATALAGSGGTGTGDMLKSVYDTNNDGIVDHVPWTGINGKPSTFPPDSTAMLKSVYDANGDNIVDSAAAVPWTGVTGKPATFPPDSTAMLKSVYDTNGDGISDHAALADTATNANAVPWTGVTGKPSTFPPDSTAMLKSVYDINNNGVVDTADAIPWTSVTGKPATFPPNITIDPGAWTTPSFSTGWSDGGSCAYRIQVIGSVSTVFCRGIASQVAGGASLAFTLPSGARPAAARVCHVAGYQNESDSTQSLVLYAVEAATSGAVNITPVIKNNAVWTSSAQSQSVYLDSLVFSL